MCIAMTLLDQEDIAQPHSVISFVEFRMRLNFIGFCKGVDGSSCIVLEFSRSLCIISSINLVLFCSQCSTADRSSSLQARLCLLLRTGWAAGDSGNSSYQRQCQR